MLSLPLGGDVPTPVQPEGFETRDVDSSEGLFREHSVAPGSTTNYWCETFAEVAWVPHRCICR
jgi:hypothetical protein